jgi:hypothetical protein
MQVLLSILLALTLGWGCSHLARQRGRNPMNWFIAGVLFGIFALILLFILPIRKRNEQANPAAAPVKKLPKLTILAPAHEEKLWYFLDEEKTQFGPMSFDALSRAWNEGKVRDSTFVWNESMEDWQRFQEVIRPSQS